MSWNKPSSAPQQPPKKSAPPSLKRGILAGLLVVALGALCYFMFRPSAATPKRDSTKDRGLIKEVAPAVAPKAKEVEKPSPEQIEREIQEGKRGPDGGKPLSQRKLSMNARLELERMRLKPSRTFGFGPDPNKRQLFKFRSEQMLESVMDMQFGEFQPLVDLPPNLDEDFMESLKHPILPEKEDTPEDKEKKRQMNELKIEIAARLKNGEKLADIIQAEKKASNAVAQYRQESNLFVRDMITNGEDAESVKAFLGELNKKLEAKGAEPIKFSNFMQRRIDALARKRGKANANQ